MPQMSPMNWLYLMYFFMLIYLFSISLTYYFTSFSPKSDKKVKNYMYKMKWY